MSKEEILTVLRAIIRMVSYYKELFGLHFKEIKFKEEDGIDYSWVSISTQKDSQYSSNEMQFIFNEYFYQNRFTSIMPPYFDGKYLVQPLYIVALDNRRNEIRATIIWVNNKLAADLVPARYKDYITEQEVKL